MSHRIVRLWASGILLAALSFAQLRADESSASPRKTKFVVQLNLAALRDTRLGDRLFGLAREEIQKELAKQAKQGEAPSLEKVAEIIGFDPFNQVQRIAVAGADYDSPEQSLIAIVEVKETTGNLEGLMLALPGYRSDEYQGHQIHAASPDKGREFFAAIHSDGSKRILLTPDRVSLESLLDEMDGRSASRSGQDVASLVVGTDAVLSVRVLEFPLDMMDEGPHANVARILKGLSLTVSGADNDLEVVISLEAKKSEQAEQLRQMMQGLLATLELARSMEPDDHDLQTVMELVQDLKTWQEGEKTVVSLRLSSDKLLRLIEDELE